MAWFVNLVAAFLTLLAIGFYVVVYTILLKRSTPQNIVIGGAAGALPPVIGWAAVTGDIGIPALLLFAIVFYWTPPHFWALSLRIRKDYAAAGVPMLPVVKGIPETTRQIGLYTILMVAISLVLWAVARMGPIYLVAAVVLGAIFLWQAYGLWRRGASEEASTAGAIRLYKYSISYLSLLFLAVAVDALVVESDRWCRRHRGPDWSFADQRPRPASGVASSTDPTLPVDDAAARPGSAGPIPSANRRSSRARSCPPRTQPPARTVSSIAVRARRIDQPNRWCTPVIRPSRGPGPRSADRYSPLPKAITRDTADHHGEPGPAPPRAAGRTAMARFVAVPMIRTLRIVPMPGRSPSGHHSARIGMPSRTLTVPIGMPSLAGDALVQGLPGTEAEAALRPSGRCPTPNRTRPTSSSR